MATYHVLVIGSQFEATSDVLTYAHYVWRSVWLAERGDVLPVEHGICRAVADGIEELGVRPPCGVPVGALVRGLIVRGVLVRGALVRGAFVRGAFLRGAFLRGARLRRRERGELAGQRRDEYLLKPSGELGRGLSEARVQRGRSDSGQEEHA